MIRGLYTSGWSMMANSKKMDIISNNLANASTNAYKKDTVVFETFPEVLTRRLNDTYTRLNPSGRIGTMQLGSDVGEVFTNYTQGGLQKTGSNLDAAIRDGGNSFFTVGIPNQDGSLTERYTRDGAFAINAEGFLVSKEGHYVLGERGPVQLTGEDFSITLEGDIIQNGDIVDRLLIRSFQDTSTLRKIGDNLLQGTADTVEVPFDGSVQQGFVEQSNVNIVREMVDMISVVRAYEANQKVLQAQDSTLEKAVNEVGAVR